MLPILKGVRILEMAILMPGDMATSILADLGAEVIKIEPPPIGDYLREVGPFDVERRLSEAHLTLNRNKKSLTLDLKKERGKQIFFSLLETADAVLELSVPGARAKLGVDYASCNKVKPDIVYVAFTGYGSTGPYAEFPSHGAGPQSFIGQIEPVRLADGRLTVVYPKISVMQEGPPYAALAVLAGLAHRNLTGEGIYLETSMAGAGIFGQHQAVFDHFNPSAVNPTARTQTTSPRLNFYECKDGKILMLMPAERRFWERFCNAIGREDLKSKGTWELPLDMGDDELEREMIPILKSKTRDEWIELLQGRGVPVMPAFTLDQVLDQEEHVEAVQLIETYNHPGYGPVTLATSPIKWPGHRFKTKQPAPSMGEHNEEILKSLGYTDADIAGLREQLVIF